MMHLQSAEHILFPCVDVLPIDIIHVQDSGACIIKLKTTVIYGICNKLECLSLASLSRQSRL
jgi:hypothetical protein